MEQEDHPLHRTYVESRLSFLALLVQKDKHTRSRRIILSTEHTSLLNLYATK